MRAAQTNIEGLYNGHAHWLSQWLERRLRCPQKAEDIRQDTFCRLIERLPDVMPVSPRNFLITVARRLMLDDIRRRDIERAVMESYALHTAQADDLTPERIAEAVEFLDEVLTALETLPPVTRNVLLLRRVGGLSQEEIARKLSLSERSVRRHMVKANVHLYTLSAEAV